MFNLPKTKNIYVSFSGGADSSLLIYELATYHKDKNIIPLIFDTGREPAYIKKRKCSKILNLIQELTKYIFEDVYVIKSEGQSPRPIDYEKFFKKHEEGHVVLGITRNPNVILKDDKHKDKGRSEDGKYICENGDVLEPEETPYAHLTKRDIAQKYYEYKLHNNLFPLTFSCITNTEKHCGECWWCQERLWGFGRII